MIAVIDSGICNLASVTSALDRINVAWIRARNSEDLAAVNAIILPGVGAFKDGIESLRQNNLFDTLIGQASLGTPILGICLGMQLLAEYSNEFGRHEGLGLIKGEVSPLPSHTGLRVPNIGWCDVQARKTSRLLPKDQNRFEKTSTFYFVHGYYFDCENKYDIQASFRFGDILVPAIIEREYIFGVQFHPEKSQDVGLEVLSNFARLAEYRDV